jgi:hypothetical protein
LLWRVCRTYLIPLASWIALIKAGHVRRPFQSLIVEIAKSTISGVTFGLRFDALVLADGLFLDVADSFLGMILSGR